jgi:iron complex outermembrane recepter protein
MNLQSIKSISLTCLALIIAGTGLTYSIPVAAQGAAMLEEIVVTARKREENLQDIPDTIVALSAETVERANIVQVRDVTAMIPNVSIEESLSPTSTFIGIRGVISTRNGEPAVSMVVDGVQIGSSTEISQAFHDVEQIEVLKGPQGALYGRNAIGGAIIVTSKAPTDELSGKVSAGYGSSEYMEFDGSLSGPVTDNLKFRIAGNFRDFNGTILNEYINELASGANTTSSLNLSSKDDAYADFETNKDIKGQLIWTPSDKTTVDVRVSYSDLETGSYWYRPTFRLESTTVEFPFATDVNTVAFRTIANEILKIDHEMGFGTITSITSHTDTEERYGVPYEGRGSTQMGDVDFLNQTFTDRVIATLPAADAALMAGTLQGVGAHNFYEIETWSQEIRLTSNDDNRLRWVAGAYYLHTDRNESIRADLTIPGSMPLEARLPNGLPGVTDLFLGGTTSGLIFDTSNVQDNDAWAVFLSADFDISDQLTLTAAIRYDEDKREITRLDGPTVNTGGEGVGSASFGGECTVGVGGCVPRGFVEKKTFRAAQPKVSLAYRPNDDLMLYATYARGFRSGGFNASGALLTEIYDKEILDSFEIGQKSTWADGRFRVNAAAFYELYDDAQVFEFDGAIFVQSLFTIPESEIYGAEMSFDWATTESLTLSGGVGVLKSKIKKFDTGIRDVLEAQLNARISNTVKLAPDAQAEFDNNFKGNKLPKFPHVSANVSATHEIPLEIFGGSTLVTRLDYRTFGNRYWWIDNTDKQGFEHVLNGSMALEFSDNWEAVLWCKNCTDTFYDYSVEPAEMVLFGGPSKDIYYQARERTFGVKVNYRF